MKVAAGQFEVFALSYEDIEEFTHATLYIVISLLERSWPLPDLKVDSNRLDHIFMPCGSGIEKTDADILIRTLNLRQAEGRMQAVVLHCNGGINRSPAVAAFVAEVLGGSGKPFFEKRNPSLVIYNQLKRYEKSIHNR